MSSDAEVTSADPRQGDYLPSIHSLRVLGQGSGRRWLARFLPESRRDRASEVLETPDGVVIATQCCDLARAGKGEVTLVKVVFLEGSAFGNAKRGHSPQYAPLPFIAESAFADLGASGTARQGLVVAQADRRSMPSSDRHKFGQRVGRRFGRFAYPDEAQPLLRWIRDKIRSKARAHKSPLGKVLDRVQTIRVENLSGWDNEPPWDLSIVIVVKDGELPTLDLAEAENVVAPTRTGSADQYDYNKVAQRLADTPSGDPNVVGLWEDFCVALADSAEKSQQFDPSVWRGVSVAAVDADDFSYARFIGSSDIDIDDLSEDEGLDR